MANSPAPRFGRYELVERIAIGGMAELYRARLGGAHDFEKPVVIKKILPHLSADPNFVSMFIDEAKITAKLQHPKIVQVFELGTTGGELFIAMEYVEGIDLLKLLRFHARRGRPVAEHIAAHIAHELLDALDHAHSAEDEDGVPMSVVHRDVSPGNVLISKRGAVKLTDFGIARAAARNQKTEAGTLKGKYGYMSPEQVVNAQIDGRSDLFAVGVVLAEMLMGKRLFSAPSDLDVLLMVRDVNLERLVRFGANIDRDLLGLVRTALTSDPEKRTQTAAEFRDQLADWLFDRRHRVAPKHIAHLVAEVRAGGVLGRDQGARGTPVASSRPVTSSTPVTAVTGPEASPGDVAMGSSSAPTPLAKSLSDPQISWRSPIDKMARGSKRLEALSPEDVQADTEGASDSLADVDSDYPLIDPDSAEGAELSLDDESLEERSKRASTSPLGDAISEAAERAFDRDLATSSKQAAAAIDDIISEEALAEEPVADHPSAPIELSDEVPIVLSDEAPPSALETPIEPIDLSDDVTLERDVVFSEPKPLNPLPDRGELGHLTALALFANLVRRKVTGRLVLVLEPTHKEIYFIDGEPKYVSSNVASERLGEFLRRKGVISEGELSMALVMLPQFDNRLIATLVGLGLMDDNQAIHMLTQQVRAKLVDACGWEKGSYRFFEEQEIPYPWLPLPLDSYEVMGAAAQTTSDEFIDGWSAWREERIPQRVNPQPVELATFRIADELELLLARIDGQKTISELREETESQMEWRRMCRLLLLLTEVGVTRIISP